MEVLEVGENIFRIPWDMMVQQVNCMGKMGRGLADQVKHRYPSIHTQYLQDYEEKKLVLGYTGFYEIKSQKNRYVACMCAQKYYGNTRQHTNYEAFETCFEQVLSFAYDHLFLKLAIPAGIGCGQGGGKWDIVKDMIFKSIETFNRFHPDYKATVYICYL